MKKTPKQIAAITALIAIFILIIGFIIAAFTTNADSGNIFFALFFCIIAIPILMWLCLLCYGRLKGKHTMAELFPDSSSTSSNSPAIPPNPEAETFTEEEITEAVEHSQK